MIDVGLTPAGSERTSEHRIIVGDEARRKQYLQKGPRRASIKRYLIDENSSDLSCTGRSSSAVRK